MRHTPQGIVPKADLLNPNCMLFHEITASSLMKADFNGNIVGPSEWPVNRAAIAIHGSILSVRPDINCMNIGASWAS